MGSSYPKICGKSTHDKKKLLKLSRYPQNLPESEIRKTISQLSDFNSKITITSPSLNSEVFLIYSEISPHIETYCLFLNYLNLKFDEYVFERIPLENILRKHDMKSGMTPRLKVGRKLYNGLELLKKASQTKNHLYLFGRTENEQRLIETLIEKISTVAIFKTNIEKINFFDKKLKGMDYLLGYLTIADFFLLELAKTHFVRKPKEIEIFTNLYDFSKRMELDVISKIKIEIRKNELNLSFVLGLSMKVSIFLSGRFNNVIENEEVGEKKKKKIEFYKLTQL